jgi:hypothetical protein
MEEKYATIVSNQKGISARLCPRGLISLHIGHTCVTLRRDDFLDLAQVVRSVETHLLASHHTWQNEQKH